MADELAKALLQLYPGARPLVDYTLCDFGAGAIVTAWNLPGAPPDAAQIAAAAAAFDQAEAGRQQRDRQLRQQVVSQAQSAAGQHVSALTPAQVRALLSILLYRAGALDTDGTVRPLASWAGIGESTP